MRQISISQRWELDTDTKASWRFVCAKTEQTFECLTSAIQNDWRSKREIIKKASKSYFSVVLLSFARANRPVICKRYLMHVCAYRLVEDRLDMATCSRHCPPCVSRPAGSEPWQNATEIQKYLVCVCVGLWVRGLPRCLHPPVRPVTVANSVLTSVMTYLATPGPLQNTHTNNE